MEPAYCQHLNTSAPGDFVEKTPVKTNRVVFWSLKLKSTKTIYKTPAIRWLLSAVKLQLWMFEQTQRTKFWPLISQPQPRPAKMSCFEDDEGHLRCSFKDAVFQSSCIPGDIVLLFFIAVDQS